MAITNHERVGKALELIGSTLGEAQSHNGLVQSWPEITRPAREGGTPKSLQAGLFAEDDLES